MGTLLQLTLSQLKGVGWAALISIGLHGALAWVFFRAPVAVFAVQPAPDPVDITIVEEPIEPLEPEEEDWPEEPEPFEEPAEPEEVEEPPPAPEETPPPERPAAMVPQVGRDDLEPGEPDSSDAAGDQVSVVEVPSIEQEPTDRPPEETPEERRRRLSALLRPDAVARGGFTATGPGPSRTGPPAGNGGRRDTGPSEADIERSLASGLRAEAMTKTHITRERVEPRRRSDGSYEWAGHAFTAVIRPDGSVDFQDQSNVQTDGISTSGRMDITDAIMGAAGQDPYAAERSRFMRETRELRERLEDAHRRGEMARGVRQLRGRLERVWATTSRSPAARRRRIFQIWDDIAEDGSAGSARRSVIAFIRETIPEGSDDAYGDAEIERLNGRRQSTERFEPY